jgi:hypothetical protein
MIIDKVYNLEEKMLEQYVFSCSIFAPFALLNIFDG